jgi:hypothetical protein
VALNGLSYICCSLFAFVVSVYFRVKMCLWNGDMLCFESVRAPWNHLHCYRNAWESSLVSDYCPGLSEILRSICEEVDRSRVMRSQLCLGVAKYLGAEVTHARPKCGL